MILVIEASVLHALPYIYTPPYTHTSPYTHPRLTGAGAGLYKPKAREVGGNICSYDHQSIIG